MIDGFLQPVLAAALVGELVLVFCNILTRSLLGISFQWANEPAELALSIIAFLGGTFAYRRGEHAYIRVLLRVLPEGVQRVCHALSEFIVLVTSVAVGWSAIALFQSRWGVVTATLGIRACWYVIPVIAGSLVLAVTATERLLVQNRRTVYITGGVVLAGLLVLGATHGTWQAWMTGEALLALTLGLFLLPLLIGLPVGFGLLLGTLGHLIAARPSAFIGGPAAWGRSSILSQTMMAGVGNFVLLALPFFVFAAIIMNEGGLSLRLVRFVQTVAGHVRGGLFQVMVISMYLVSGLSGSKVADVAAVGSVMRDMLRKEGYDLEQATAVLAASAVMGETVPPSIPMLVLGSVTTLSIGSLFVAGVIPAAVVGLCLMGLIYVQSRRSHLRLLARAPFAQMAQASLSAVLPLLMPIILLGGIMGGVGTPTEVSSFAVVYGLVVAGLVYRELGFRPLLKGVIDCATMSGMILFILAAASSFAWTLTMALFPQKLVELLTSAHQSEWVFMVASIALLIVTGSILEGLPALLILAPILLPIAAQVGVSQLHYGIVLVISMGIGAFAPPVGACFYVTCAICGTTLERSARKMIPYLVVLVIGILLVAFIPWFTLFLPVKFHLAG
jgi:tripartite ATP-independent transporter DctM subunit